MTSQTLATSHLIATHRSLKALTEWGVDFAKQAAESGRRVLWAPAHALGGCVSLRTWILDQAAQALGDAAPEDVPLLLSGAADAILIADPASADAASLHWLTDMLACTQEVADLTAVPPMPQLVVLVPSRSATGAVSKFLGKLEALGSEEVKVTSRGNDATVASTDIAAVLGRNDDLLAALALAPVPLKLEDINALAGASGKSGLPVSDLVSGPLFQIAGDIVTPTSADVTRLLREKLPAESLPRGAALLLPVVEARYESLTDARVELSLRSGDAKRAGKLARRRFEEHLSAGRTEEALRLVEVARALDLSIESGKFAAEIDDAKLACLAARVGRHAEAAKLVAKLAKRRDAFVSADFIQWLGQAAGHLALHAGFDPRLADSLMRRAIRSAGDSTDLHVRFTLIRVKMLSSDVYNLMERSGWLLSHINNEMLEDVSPATLAQYLEDTAFRMWNTDDVRGAIRRLRKLITMQIGDRQMARGLLLLARCRNFVADHDAALRFATSSLHHALRATDLELVKAAATFLREIQKGRPGELPPLAPSGKGAKARPRHPAVAGIQAPSLSDARQVYEIMQTRFGVTHWVRRRGQQTSEFGSAGALQAPVSVFQETEGGHSRVTSGEGAIALLRSDGSDFVAFEAASDGESRDEALVRLLLADRDATQASSAAEPPSRKAVIADYHRRALAHGIDRGLHTIMEVLFNKDVLLYFEEQGIGKEEMAERIGVSRATLYRMYARSGLNI